MHAEKAVEIARETKVEALPIATNPRQGDVILLRVSDCDRDRKGYKKVPFGGVVVAAGRHGEHRLMADRYDTDGTILVLPDGGLLVHTDVPEARHATVRVGPGIYDRKKLRELSLNGLIQDVSD